MKHEDCIKYFKLYEDNQKSYEKAQEEYSIAHDKYSQFCDKFNTNNKKILPVMHNYIIKYISCLNPRINFKTLKKHSMIYNIYIRETDICFSIEYNIEIYHSIKNRAERMKMPKKYLNLKELKNLKLENKLKLL